MDSSAQSLDLQIQKLEEKIRNAQLPQDLLEKVNGITSLPFNKETKDILDLNSAQQILDKNHYGLTSVKNRIMEYLSSIILSMQNNTTDGIIRAPILCLIGLVGTGKTTLAYSIAQALGRKFERIPFGGMGDARALRGQSRAYADAEPGAIIKKIVAASSKNPVILLDELDRITETARADIMGVLVELLDPEQNRNYSDHYIDYPFDLSHVLFVATANNTTDVSTAVLDRLEVVQMPSYTDDEKTTIAKSYLFPKVKTASGLPDNQLQIDDNVWPFIIRPLGFDAGIRSLERTIEGVCRKAARMIVEGKVPAGSYVHITSENYKQFLPN